MKSVFHHRAAAAVAASLVVLAVACSKTARVTGVVVRTFTGAPVEGATITAKTKTDIQEERGFAELTTTTNAKGEYSLASPLHGQRYLVQVRHPDYFNFEAVTDFPALDQTKQLRQVQLAHLPALVGKVLSCVEAKPVAGVRVAVTSSAQVATSDKDGNFRIDRLARGSQGVSLTIGANKTDAMVTAKLLSDAKQNEEFHVCQDDGKVGLKRFEAPYIVKTIGSLAGLGEPRQSAEIERRRFNESVKKLEKYTNDFIWQHNIDGHAVDAGLVAVRKGSRLLVPANPSGFQQFRLFKYGSQTFRTWVEDRITLPAGYYVGIQEFKVSSETSTALLTATTYYHVAAKMVYDSGVDIGGDVPGLPGYVLATVSGEVGGVYLLAPLEKWPNSGDTSWSRMVYFVKVVE